MKWTTVSNGHTLTVTMDTEKLIEHLNNRINDFKDEIREIKASSADETDCRWERRSVYGDPESDFVTPEECIADLEDMKECILKLAADAEGSSIWPMVVLKKNGTFKRNCKPFIREEKFGPYWEDSYGWNVEVLRIEPITDTNAEIVLTNIVQHY